METLLPIILVISAMTAVIACNKGFAGHGGWGEPHPVIILPKPTLIPKLKQAFIDGKLSVDYHKIVAPSLKPLPYKKGVGWIGKGWGHGFNSIGGGYGFDHFIDYPFGVGKTGYLGLGYGKGIGLGKGIGVGLKGPIGGHIPPIGHHIPVTPIAPLDHKLPIPHGPVGPIGPVSHIGHTVSHNAVTVVEKGLPHVGIPHGPIGPIGNDLYGK